GQRFAVHHDVGAGAFTEPGVGHGDGGGAGDPRVAQQQQFHLAGVDLLAAPVDDVLDPALDADVPLAGDLTDRGQVTGAVEAVRSERPGVVRGRVEVSAHRVRAAAAQLADPAVGKLGGGARLEDPDLVQRGQRGADRGRAGFAGCG